MIMSLPKPGRTINEWSAIQYQRRAAGFYWHARVTRDEEARGNWTHDKMVLLQQDAAQLAFMGRHKLGIE